jgi:hypothetical protein
MEHRESKNAIFHPPSSILDKNLEDVSRQDAKNAKVKRD